MVEVSGGQVVYDLTVSLLNQDMYKKVYVAFAPDNSGAEKFYRSIGFNDTGIKNYDEDPVFEILKRSNNRSLKEVNPSSKIDPSIRIDWEKGSREALSEWSWDDWKAGKAT